MGAIVDKLKEWWQQADQTQKLVSGFGIAFLIVILGFTAFFATRPKMTAVFPGISEADKSMVYDELSKAGFQVDLQGNPSEVVVPTQDVARARMVLAGGNNLPQSKGDGMDLINGIGIGDSPIKEIEKVKAAKELELENSIATMEGVADVWVGLNLGKDGAFVDESAPPSASIKITEQNDGIITTDQAKAMTRLVEFAITNLKSENITVITDSGRMLFDGKDEGSVGTIANRKIEAENIESKRRTVDLQRRLDQVFGMGNTNVEVQVTLNMDTTSIQTDETTTGTDPLYEEKTGETLESEGGMDGGASGMESNGATGTTAATGDTGKSSYENTASAVQYPTQQKKTAVQKAAGDVVAMNVTVMANSTNLDEEAMAGLDTYIANYIAPYAGDNKFTANVTPVAFNNQTEEMAKKAEAQAEAAQRMQQLVSILPVIALILVGVVLVRSIGKTLRGQSRQMVLSNGQTISLPAGTDPEVIAMIENAALPNEQGQLPGGYEGVMQSLAGHADGEDDEEIVEEDTGEVDDNGDPIIVKRKRKKRRIIEDDDDDDFQPVGSIKKKVDVPLEQIKKMSKKNPEAVAMLLKSWIMEERN